MGGPDVDLLHLGIDQHCHDPVRRPGHPAARHRPATGSRAPRPGRQARSRTDGARRRCTAAGATGTDSNRSSGSTSAAYAAGRRRRARATRRSSAAHDVAIALAAIEVDGQDRRELGAGRAQEGQPIRLGAGHGVLMPSHIPPRTARDAAGPGRPARTGRPASAVRGVRVVVDRCVRASPERAIGLHDASAAAADGVRILARRELQADRVSVVAPQQLRLEGGADDVVGWAGEIREVGHLAACENCVRLIRQANALGDDRLGEALRGVGDRPKGAHGGHAPESSRAG